MKPSGFYVDPFLRCSLILIPSIQHEKSDYLFQDNRFFLSDPPGGGTLYYLSLIINYLSFSLTFSPPISPRLNFFVLHLDTTLLH